MTNPSAKAKSSRWRRSLDVLRRRLKIPNEAAPPHLQVIESGLFDARWYLERYPDIAAANLDPLEHFLGHGGAEGRSPGPRFDTRWYVDAYPDVSASGLNPLVHFIRHGQGRAGSIDALSLPSGQEALDIQELQDTPLFDGSWYAKTYRVSADPLLVARHYLLVGARKGHAPSRAFDGAQYLAANPDVQSAGENPLLHYLRHGRGEGRRVFRHDAGASSASPLLFGDDALTAKEESKDAVWTPASRFSRDKRKTLTIAGTPAALLPSAGIPLPEFRPLALFARLAGHDLDKFARAGRGKLVLPDLAARPLHFDDLQLPVQDGWFSSDRRLTLRLPPQSAEGVVVRVFQATSSKAGMLAEAFVGQSGRLLAVELENPLLPLLLVVTRIDGELQSSHLMPFPSLFRGGLHHGEAEALGRGANSTDRQRSHAFVLLREILGWSSAGEPSLGRIVVDVGQATGNEPIFTDAVRGWLSHLGIKVAALPMVATHPGQRHCVDAVSLAPPAPRGAHGALTITADSLPSLLAISSRRLADGIGSFITADGGDAPTPRLLVRLPPMAAPDQTSLPLVHGTNRNDARGSTATVAIRYRTPSPPSLATLAYPIDASLPIPAVRGHDKSVKPDVTVILSGGEGSDLHRPLETLRRQAEAGRVRIVICGTDESAFDWAAAGADAFVATPSGAPPAAVCNLAAEHADGSWLLFIDADVALHDSRTLAALIDRAGADSVATASCMRICDTGFANGQAVTAQSAGLFPTHIDFFGSPAIAFLTPDVTTALAHSTYPVAANGLEFMLVSTDAWRALGGFDADAHPFEGFALDFQLRAVSKGWINICTTEVSVLDLKRDRTDRPDVLSSAELSPRQWGDILERVTIVRRLD